MEDEGPDLSGGLWGTGATFMLSHPHFYSLVWEEGRASGSRLHSN